MVTVETGFDPERHGFRFVNTFRGGTVLDELSRRGRLDELVGFEVASVLSALVAVTGDASFWGRFGLCGGMSWAALDRFHADVPPPADTTPPGEGSALFGELVGRQADSMAGRAMITRCLRWQLLPDAPPWWWPWLRSVGRETSRTEWPRLRASLDGARPESLCLLRVKGVANPGEHHQVVATGYRRDGSQVVISLYDPNHPASLPELRMRLGPRGRLLELTQSTGEEIHGFFVQPWQPAHH